MAAFGRTTFVSPKETQKLMNKEAKISYRDYKKAEKETRGVKAKIFIEAYGMKKSVREWMATKYCHPELTGSMIRHRFRYWGKTNEDCISKPPKYKWTNT